MAVIRRFACIGEAAEPSEEDRCFSVADYPVETEPSVFEKRRIVGDTVRESLRVTLYGTAAEIKAAFADGVHWYIRNELVSGSDPDADAEEQEQEAEEVRCYDQTAFCLAGDVVDHRNGKVTFYMAKKTAAEVAIEALEAENARLLSGQSANA